jgi:protein-tyrosine phosphatase
MKYAVLLSFLGAAQIAVAFEVGRLAPLLWWSSGSWILVGCAYGFLGPGIFGKRPDGRLTWWNAAILLPFISITWLIWYVQRLIRRESQCAEVGPGLWLGRRCSADELPNGTQLVADLTCEFSEPRSVVHGRTYICVPTLDAAAPPAEPFRSLVQSIVECDGPVYVHCALGHGRSATVVAAVMVARGMCATIDEAEQIIKHVRPRIEINNAQKKLLRQLFG